MDFCKRVRGGEGAGGGDRGTGEGAAEEMERVGVGEGAGDGDIGKGEREGELL